MRRCSLHALGPLIRMATESNSWVTVSAGAIPAALDLGVLDRVEQLGGTHQEAVAPGGALGAVAQLGQRRRQHLARRLAVGSGEDGVAGQLGGEAQVALIEEADRLGTWLDPAHHLT